MIFYKRLWLERRLKVVLYQRWYIYLELSRNGGLLRTSTNVGSTYTSNLHGLIGLHLKTLVPQGGTVGESGGEWGGVGEIGLHCT